MADENLNQDQTGINETAEAVQPEQTGKKKVRVGYIFLSIVPVAALLAIQTVCQIPFLVLASLGVAKNASAGGLNYSELEKTTMEVFSEKYLSITYSMYIVAGLIVFGLWYYKAFVKKNPKVGYKEVFGVKSILSALGLGFGLNLVISAVFLIVATFFPHAFDAYNELVKTAGLENNWYLIIAYVIILGPILEELCLRGVTFSYLEKSGIRPIFVVLISGVLFGAMHLNIVQGLYTSVFGFFLGFLRYKYRSIKITIVTHIIFNLLGTVGSMALDKLGATEGVYYILGGVGLFVIVFASVLVNTDKKAFKAAKEA